MSNINLYDPTHVLSNSLYLYNQKPDANEYELFQKDKCLNIGPCWWKFDFVNPLNIKINEKSGMAIKDNGEKTLSAKRLKMHVMHIHPDVDG